MTGHRPRRRGDGQPRQIVGHAGRTIAIDARYKKPALALDAVFDAGRRDYSPFTLSDVELHHATKATSALPEIEKLIELPAARVVRRD